MEHEIFGRLMKMNPTLKVRVVKASEQELHYIADMVRSESTLHGTMMFPLTVTTIN